MNEKNKEDNESRVITLVVLNFQQQKEVNYFKILIKNSYSGLLFVVSSF
jgi:hypothetical protein